MIKVAICDDDIQRHGHWIRGDGYEKYFKNNAYDDYNFYDSRFCCLCRGNTGFRLGSVNNEQRLDRNQ